MARLALVIGNATFEDRQNFPGLRAPLNDARQVAKVFKECGQFQISDLLLDEPADRIQLAINRFYRQADRGDLTLLYYSGHGYREDSGRLYLAARNTRADYVLATGISNIYINDAIRVSKSRFRVIILDCCYSGLFIGGEKGSSLVLDELTGEASAIMTSTDRITPSFEDKEKEGDRDSFFTRYLLEGIRTGEADQDEDGVIGIDELFHYAQHRLRDVRPGQSPMLDWKEREGSIFLAETPVERMEAIRRRKRL